MLAAIAVPGFLRARKRSQASKIINDLRLIDAAVDQYAIENWQGELTSTVTVADWTELSEEGYQSLCDRQMTSSATLTAPKPSTQYRRCSTSAYNTLSDVADNTFWSPYY